MFEVSGVGSMFCFVFRNMRFRVRLSGRLFTCVMTLLWLLNSVAVFVVVGIVVVVVVVVVWVYLFGLLVLKYR